MTSYQNAISGLKGDESRYWDAVNRNNINLADREISQSQANVKFLANLSPTLQKLVQDVNKLNIKRQEAGLLQSYLENESAKADVPGVKSVLDSATNTSYSINEASEKARRNNTDTELLNRLSNANPLAAVKVSNLIINSANEKYEPFIQNALRTSTDTINTESGEVAIKDINQLPIGTKAYYKRIALSHIKNKFLAEQGLSEFGAGYLELGGFGGLMRKTDAKLSKQWTKEQDIEQGANDRTIATDAWISSEKLTADGLLELTSVISSSSDLKGNHIGWTKAWGKDYIEKIIINGFKSGKITQQKWDDLLETKVSDDHPNPNYRGKTLAKIWESRFGENGVLELALDEAQREHYKNSKEEEKVNHHADESDAIVNLEKAFKDGIKGDELKAIYNQSMAFLNAKYADFEGTGKKLTNIYENLRTPDETKSEVATILKDMQEKPGSELNLGGISTGAAMDPRVAKLIAAQKAVEDSGKWKDAEATLKANYVQKAGLTDFDVKKGVLTSWHQEGFDAMQKDLRAALTDYYINNDNNLPRDFGSFVQKVTDEYELQKDVPGAKYFYNDKLIQGTTTPIGYQNLSKISFVNTSNFIDNLGVTGNDPQALARRGEIIKEELRSKFYGMSPTQIKESGLLNKMEGPKTFDYNNINETGTNYPLLVKHISNATGIPNHELAAIFHDEEVFEKLDLKDKNSIEYQLSQKDIKTANNSSSTHWELSTISKKLVENIGEKNYFLNNTPLNLEAYEAALFNGIKPDLLLSWLEAAAVELDPNNGGTDIFGDINPGSFDELAQVLKNTDAGVLLSNPILREMMGKQDYRWLETEEDWYGYNSMTDKDLWKKWGLDSEPTETNLTE